MGYLKSLALFGAMMTVSLTSFAEEKCENYAKASAIRAYKAELPTIQGSDGISYIALLLGEQSGLGLFDYIVSIGENNEDGDYWEIDYAVRVQALEETDKCETVSTTKLFLRSEPRDY